MVVKFHSAADVRARYPGQWNIVSGTWGHLTSKIYGPFICMALHLHGQEVRWRIKQLFLIMDDKDEFTKYYRTVRAGRSVSLTKAVEFMENSCLPFILSVNERRQYRQDVLENVG